MPTVPQRQYPEFDAPSDTHMAMAAASLRQRFEPSNEGLTKEDLEGHNVKTLSGMKAFVNPERFHEAQKSWPESKNIEYATPTRRSLKELMPSDTQEAAKDPIGNMIKKLDIREYPVSDAEIQKMMRKQRDKLR